MDRRQAIPPVLLTLAAWGCWQGMEAFPDYSPESTALFYGGNVLIVIALYYFYRLFMSQTK